MPHPIGRQICNSVVQILNGLGSAGLNFIVVLFYARWLGPEIFGRFVTSQAQVLVWIVIVDLGITSGLIGALHRENISPKRLLTHTLLLRLTTATLGTICVGALSWFTSHDRSVLIQDLAFTPHLFAYAFQYTLTSYLAFRNRIKLSVFANLAGVLVANGLTLYLAYSGASVSTLLLAQSWGGILAALIMFLSIDIPKDTSQKTKRNVIPAIWTHSWPNFAILITTVLWSRLDQVFAARWLGFELSGQYGFAVRLVAVPALMLASTTFALFSDLQRVGRDAPHKISVFAGLASKVLFRYGAVFGAVVLLSLGYGILPFVPKFRPAIHLLVGFLPGVWCYAIYSILIGSLMGTQRYAEIVKLHFIALGFYLIALPFLTRSFGVFGMIASYDLFAIILAQLCYLYLKKTKVISFRHRIYGPYTPEEKEFLAQVMSKLLRAIRKREKTAPS